MFTRILGEKLWYRISTEMIPWSGTHMMIRTLRHSDSFNSGCNESPFNRWLWSTHRSPGRWPLHRWIYSCYRRPTHRWSRSWPRAELRHRWTGKSEYIVTEIFDYALYEFIKSLEELHRFSLWLSEGNDCQIVYDGKLTLVLTFSASVINPARRRYNYSFQSVLLIWFL